MGFRNACAIVNTGIYCGAHMTDILQLPSLKPLVVRSENDTYLIEATGRFTPTICPGCGSSRLHGHGTQDQIYRDAPLHGMAVQIIVKRRRYRCLDCGKTLYDPIPDLDSKRLATIRLVSYIRLHCFRETFASIARQVNMDEKTIRNIFDDYVDELQGTISFVTPRYLGIDELKIIGAYRAILTNVEHKTVFDMCKTRTKADLLPYFRNLPDKGNIEWVAMDMYHVYRQVVHTTLPEARIVVDKFHIQRMANEVLEVLRKQLRKGLPERQRLRLKDERFLLLKRQHTLKPQEMDRLLAWFKQFPLLAEAHALKEGYLSIWDNTNRSAAEADYQIWLGNLSLELEPKFKQLTTATRNWHEEIFAYFDKPITNAYTESANNLAKGMNRMGRGYSFEVIRARMLYDKKARKGSSVILTTPADDGQGMLSGMHSKGTPTMSNQKATQTVIEYGPYIPTLVKLLENGYFE